MAIIKSILENVIKSGKFDLARATNQIEEGYISGEYSEEERAEQLTLRDQHLMPENHAPALLETYKRLEAKYAELEKRVSELEKKGTEEPESPEAGEETPEDVVTYPAWEAWDGIPGSAYKYGDKVTHNGVIYESRYQGENVWEPGAIGTESLWVIIEE